MHRLSTGWRPPTLYPQAYPQGEAGPTPHKLTHYAIALDRFLLGTPNPPNRPDSPIQQWDTLSTAPTLLYPQLSHGTVGPTWFSLYNVCMVLGPQFHDAFGPEPLKSKAISIINTRADSSNPMIGGEDARKVFRAANIRQWPLKVHHSEYRQGYSGEWTESVPATTTLHTSQKYLNADTLQEYMAGKEPAFDEDYGEDVPYDPEILASERGTRWIDEGHHRLIASRLRGEPSRRVYSGPLG